VLPTTPTAPTVGVYSSQMISILSALNFSLFNDNQLSMSLTRLNLTDGNILVDSLTADMNFVGVDEIIINLY